MRLGMVSASTLPSAGKVMHKHIMYNIIHKVSHVMHTNIMYIKYSHHVHAYHNFSDLLAWKIDLIK